MLFVRGRQLSMCDGLNRRAFLCAGGLATFGHAIGSVTLADVLRAQSEARPAETGSSRPKSVIVVFLPGGPSHLDLLDLKPGAPIEIRGEFQPIDTAVPGIQISELLPQLARVTDKLAIIRTIVGGPDDHACHPCLTGHSRLGPQPSGNWPSLGAVVSRFSRSGPAAVPPAVGLAAKMLHPPYNDPGPGFLGPAHAPCTTYDEFRDDLVLPNLHLNRLGSRRELLQGLDRFRRAADASGMAAGMDAFQAQAFGLLTGSRMADALDISREDERTRALYGPGDKSLVTGFNAAPKLPEQFLIARRMVEAGVRCVTLAFGAWDWHVDNFVGHRQEAPLLDRGLAALVTDLHERGLSDDVAVVVWGEFGRTPRINKTAGRDHWPGVSCALMAGGGWRTGQVVGATNRLAEIPASRPVHFQEVFATIYRHLGIEPTSTLSDLSGRPHYLLDQAHPIAELLA